MKSIQGKKQLITGIYVIDEMVVQLCFHILHSKVYDQKHSTITNFSKNGISTNSRLAESRPASCRKILLPYNSNEFFC
jgi:hypothetical protein